jgi:hypothetical protein
MTNFITVEAFDIHIFIKITPVPWFIRTTTFEAYSNKYYIYTNKVIKCAKFLLPTLRIIY